MNAKAAKELTKLSYERNHGLVEMAYSQLFRYVMAQIDDAVNRGYYAVTVRPWDGDSHREWAGGKNSIIGYNCSPIKFRDQVVLDLEAEGYMVKTDYDDDYVQILQVSWGGAKKSEAVE